MIICEDILIYLVQLEAQNLFLLFLKKCKSKDPRSSSFMQCLLFQSNMCTFYIAFFTTLIDARGLGWQGEGLCLYQILGLQNLIIMSS